MKIVFACELLINYFFLFTSSAHEISLLLLCPLGRSGGSELWRRRTSSSDPAQRQGLVLYNKRSTLSPPSLLQVTYGVHLEPRHRVQKRAMDQPIRIFKYYDSTVETG